MTRPREAEDAATVRESTNPIASAPFRQALLQVQCGLDMIIGNAHNALTKKMLSKNPYLVDPSAFG